MRRLKMMLFVMLPMLVAGLLTSCSNEPKEPEKGRASAKMNVDFYSESLQKDMHMSVYLPPDYNAKDRFPVLYVLHSYTKNENYWFDILKIHEIADELIAAGKIEPMIIVAPRIDNSFGVNSSDVSGYLAESGSPEDAGVLCTGKYEDYITKDVVAFVDDHFKTIESREDRYLAGMSMGGFAALHVGFKHPELYSKVGGHAPAMFTGSIWAPLQKLIFPTAAAKELNDPIALAAHRDLSKLNIYLDYGDQDDYKLADETLDGILKGVKTKSYESHVIPEGRHEDGYWVGQMEKYLVYYGE